MNKTFTFNIRLNKSPLPFSDPGVANVHELACFAPAEAE